MPALPARSLAALVAAGAVGLSLGACSDRQSESQGNDGGTPIGVTSPTPTATSEGTGVSTEAIPPSATVGQGTIPDPNTGPTADNPGGAEAPGESTSTTVTP